MANDVNFKDVTHLLTFDYDDPEDNCDPYASSIVLASDFTKRGSLLPDFPYGTTITGGTASYTTWSTMKESECLCVTTSDFLRYNRGISTTKTITTIELDYNISAAPAASATYNGIVSLQQSTSIPQLAVYISTDLRLGLRFRGAVYSNGPYLELNKWYRLTISYDGYQTCRLFVDGVLQITLINTIAPTNDTASNINLNQYATYASTTSFYRRLRIYQGPTAPVYVANFTPSNSKLKLKNIYDYVADDGWLTVGSPNPSSAVTKFGGRALYLNGSSALRYKMEEETIGNMTLEGWFYCSAASWSAQPALLCIGDSMHPYGLAILIRYDGTPAIYFEGGNTVFWSQVRGRGKAPVGEWFHLAYCKNGDYHVVFINGVPECMILDSGAITQKSIAVGWDASTKVTANFFTGYVDSIRFTKGVVRYPFTLTDPYAGSVRLWQPLRWNTANLIVEQNYHKTVSNTAVTATLVNNPFDGALTYCAGFNGSSSRLYISTTQISAATTDNMTIEGWIRLSDTTGNRPIFSAGWTATSTSTYMLCVEDGYLKFYHTTTGPTVVTLTGTTLMSTNTWYHIAVSRDTDTMRLYVNGVKDAEQTGWANYTIGAASDIDLYIGRNNSSSAYFKGNMLDIVFTIAGRYKTDTFPVPTDYYSPFAGSPVADIPTEPFPLKQPIITGKVLDSSGAGMQSRVYAYSYTNGQLIGQAVSNATTGEFTMDVFEKCYCVCIDDSGNRNTVVYDNVIPS